MRGPVVGLAGFLAGCASYVGAESLVVDEAPAAVADVDVVPGGVLDAEPIPEVEPHEITAIAMTAITGCALRQDGTASCWGSVMDGPNRAKLSREPEAFGSFDDLARMAIGRTALCALDPDGAPRCWAGAIPELPPIAEVHFAGNFSCARLEDGAGVCWPSFRPHLAKDLPLDDIVQLDSKFSHACAVTGDGAVYCWGSNSGGQLGRPVEPLCAPFCPSCSPCPDAQMQPRRVPGLPRMAEVATGGSHTCARTRKGEVYCWGWNAFGSLGDGTNTPRHEPRRVEGVPPVVQLVAGAYNNAARVEDGSIWTWGWIYREEARTRWRPVRVEGIEHATAVATWTSATCAIIAGREITCWGDDHFKQLGPFASDDVVIPLDPG